MTAMQRIMVAVGLVMGLLAATANLSCKGNHEHGGTATTKEHGGTATTKEQGGTATPPAKEHGGAVAK